MACSFPSLTWPLGTNPSFPFTSQSPKLHPNSRSAILGEDWSSAGGFAQSVFFSSIPDLHATRPPMYSCYNLQTHRKAACSKNFPYLIHVIHRARVLHCKVMCSLLMPSMLLSHLFPIFLMALASQHYHTAQLLTLILTFLGNNPDMERRQWQLENYTPSRSTVQDLSLHLHTTPQSFNQVTLCVLW